MDETELEVLRQSVRGIDRELVPLLEKRLKVSQTVAKCQLKARVPVYDADQEEKNIHNLSELLDHVSQQKDFIMGYQLLMGVGKKVLKVALNKEIRD